MDRPLHVHVRPTVYAATMMINNYKLVTEGFVQNAQQPLTHPQRNPQDPATTFWQTFYVVVGPSSSMREVFAVLFEAILVAKLCSMWVSLLQSCSSKQDCL